MIDTDQESVKGKNNAYKNMIDGNLRRARKFVCLTSELLVDGVLFL